MTWNKQGSNGPGNRNQHFNAQSICCVRFLYNPEQDPTVLQYIALKAGCHLRRSRGRNRSRSRKRADDLTKIEHPSRKAES